MLDEKKCLILPKVDLILQSNKNDKIECYSGQATLDKLRILCDIAQEMSEPLICYELRDLDILPEVIELSGDTSLPN